VKLLMDRDDLNINAKDNRGYIAFDLACLEGQIEIVKLLMSRDDFDISKREQNVRNEEIRWKLSPNNFCFRAALHSIGLARGAAMK